MDNKKKYKKNKCCVPSCNDRTSQRHGFPKDASLCKKWIENIRSPELNDLIPEKLYKKYVCHMHFAKEDHEPGAQRGLLRFAVPTIFPWNVKHAEGISKSLDSTIITETNIDSNSSVENDEKHAEAISKSPDSIIITETNIDSNSSVENDEGNFENSTTITNENEDTASPVDYKIPSEKGDGSHLSEDSSNIKYTEEALLLLKMCRLCLLNPGKYRISEEEGLNKKISDYIKIKLVETPNYPQLICTCCKTLLDTVSCFAAKVHTANEKLKRILDKTDTNPLIETVKEPIDESENIVEQIEEPKQETIDVDSFKGRFKCDICGERFHFLKQYKKHKITHMVSYVCDVVGCGQMFSTESRFKRHNHTRPNKPKKLALTHRKYACRLCNESFLSVKLLKEHKGTHINFKCPKDNCGTILKNYKTFDHHMFLHNNIQRFLCQVCGKTFHRYYQLCLHENVHKGIKYKCDICGISYPFKTTLTEHMHVKHKGRRFYCSMCPNSYASRLALSHHEKVHSGKRDFQCNLCPKSFFSKGNLKMHILVHQGIKQYQCNVCLKCFVMKSTLKVHEKIHVDKKFRCNVEGCEKQFKRIDGLKSHMKLLHPEELDR